MHQQDEFRLAIFKNNSTRVAEMVNEDPDLLDIKFENGFSCLHLCAAYAGCELASILISAGALREARDKLGFTPLLVSGLMVKDDLLTFLIDKGCDLSSCNLKGETLCHLCTNTHHYQFLPEQSVREEAKVLDTLVGCVKMGININTQNFAGQTPLHYAIATYLGEGKSAYMEICLRLGADPNIVDKCGASALFYLAEGALTRIPCQTLTRAIELFIKNGALDLPNNEGLIPSDLLGKSPCIKDKKFSQTLAKCFA